MLTIALPKTGVYLMKNDSKVRICEQGNIPHWYDQMKEKWQFDENDCTIVMPKNLVFSIPRFNASMTSWSYNQLDVDVYKKYNPLVKGYRGGFAIKLGAGISNIDAERVAEDYKDDKMAGVLHALKNLQ